MNQPQAQFDVRRIPLDAAADREVRELVGHVFQVIDASSSSAALQITVNEPDARSYPVRVGFGWMHSPFTRVYISNTAQPGEWVDVAYGGDPLLAKPELFQLFPVSNASAVTIEGQSGDVDVNINAQLNPVIVEPAGILLDSASPMMSSISTSLTGTTTAFTTYYTVPPQRVTKIKRGMISSSSGGTVASAKIVVGGVDVVRADSPGAFAGQPCFDDYVMPAGSLIKLKNNTAGQKAYLSLWMEETDA